MKRKFMARILEGTKKIAAPAETETGSAAETAKGSAPEAAQDAPHRAEGEDAKKTRGERTGRETAQIGYMDIFDDTDVCRALGVRRRVLVRARTEKARGEAWDAKGAHAGMTRKWIEGRKKGASEGIRPIEGADGIVTVRFVRRVANAKLAGVRMIASGMERVAWVHDANAMNLGDEFDCRWIGKQLHYVDALNREAY